MSKVRIKLDCEVCNCLECPCSKVTNDESLTYCAHPDAPEDNVLNDDWRVPQWCPGLKDNKNE